MNVCVFSVAVKKVSSAVFVFLYTWLEKLCSCARLEIRLAFVFTVQIMVRLMSLNMVHENMFFVTNLKVVNV